jgi:squalene-hopene/tetraprenyl-beta-curcumene cyclase
MKAVILAICILAGCLGVSMFATDENSSMANSPAWSSKAAAEYLDGRMVWWMSWDKAARDHQTFCVSCHTVLPYAMARPALRAALAEQGPSAPERQVLASVTKRVRMWKDVEPFYPDGKRGVPKTAESRGTESVLNAMVLVGYDAPTGKLGPDARMAFDNMWSEQLKTGDARGAWSWLQFHNSPWEGDSQYFGAVLAALAVGTAPANYQSTPEIQDNMKLLRDYLVRERESQILINRVNLLWASTKVPGLLTPEQQKSIIDEALSKQQADGGFSLSAFVGGWKRHDGTPLVTKSDGYATGAVMLVLQQAGMKCDQPQLKRGLTWLMQNQDKSEGRWLAYSLNHNLDVSTYTGHFMSDAATAYAVLALENARH